MKRTVMLALLALLAAIATVRPAVAQQPRHEPSHTSPGHGHFEQHLFPPELIMQQQRNIGLTAEQRATITKAVQDLQARVLDFQWKMEDETQKLGERLREPTVDETAVLAQVDRVLGIEREVKRAHLALLVRIKNTLTAEQQAKLTAAKNAMHESPPPR